MPTVQREITVPAEPDEVWEALTEASLRDAWLQDPGAPREITDERADPDAGRYAFRWAHPGEAATEVRFTVHAVPAGTRVVVVESAPSGVRWPATLRALAAHVPAFA